jgi:hypothetical protein
MGEFGNSELLSNSSSVQVGRSWQHVWTRELWYGMWNVHFGKTARELTVVDEIVA